MVYRFVHSPVSSNQKYGCGPGQALPYILWAMGIIFTKRLYEYHHDCLQICLNGKATSFIERYLCKV